jgi:hypothetical protein
MRWRYFLIWMVGWRDLSSPSFMVKGFRAFSGVGLVDAAGGPVAIGFVVSAMLPLVQICRGCFVLPLDLGM